MRIIKIWSCSIDPQQLHHTCETLESGGIIIWRTDSRYAFACDATNRKSVEQICRIKRIDIQKSRFSLAFAGISEISDFVRLDNSMFQLLKYNTPGAFTFIMRPSRNIPSIFKARKEIGIRIPDSEVALSILREFGKPIMTTSLPDEDPDYAVNPDLISEKYSNNVDLLLDCGLGVLDETTVVDCTVVPYKILREGVGFLCD